ncbi:TRAP-like protein [Saitoella complicata NRRL Y-17804]|uniref:Altered inheritance of mitochondria protein 24, mitochondrial n=1 Tax=Saitoella complicata (strain BCRC 22490 / CBS 7301 / JCM 7358 / NBRC 10748 / NRRL Y-17804) TaxID=698492 RepID=A0A0E9NAH0_SAICN|nr:TRAP-like protein [Saitoella complicata NRRL Y-17804]ODQ55901.1 TRAP-like protein [Saitoella complicata NRRL Y-17804]GAO46808.1 hypothetical protein G7K_1026-t1 [Saitoella complicata NRRL Y-17804]
MSYQNQEMPYGQVHSGSPGQEWLQRSPSFPQGQYPADDKPRMHRGISDPAYPGGYPEVGYNPSGDMSPPMGMRAGPGSPPTYLGQNMVPGHNQSYGSSNEKIGLNVTQSGVPTQVAGRYGNIMSWELLYRSTNTLLKVQLQAGASLNAHSGCMVGMSHSIAIESKTKFGNMFKSGEVFSSTFHAKNGPGYILLAPAIYSDVIALEVNGSDGYLIGDAEQYIASTLEIKKETKFAGLSNGVLSGTGLAIIKISGRGVCFVKAIGAIHRIDLQPGEDFIIDNGHLCAWTSTMKLKTETAGGFFTSLKTGEGIVCRFTGPGTIYLQTRKPKAVAAWIKEQME